MKPEYQLLFIATRQDFQERHARAIEALAQNHALDWELIYSLVESHGVAPLIYINLAQRTKIAFGIPPAILKKLQLYVIRNTLIEEKRAQLLAEALSYFRQRSVDVLLVKGAALDLLVYEQPWYTYSQDTDIVLKVKFDQVSPEALKDLQHYLHRKGIEYDFYEHHDLNINGALPVDFDRIWSDATSIPYRDEAVLVMAPEDLLISVCINSCRKRYFRLKSLLDLAETVRKYPQMPWEKVLAKTRDYDCDAIVYTAFHVTQQTLGCDLPEGVLAGLKVNPARAKVIRSLVHYLVQNPSLSSYPFSGRGVFGRELNLAVALPYASYRYSQIWRKMGEIIQARKPSH